MSGENLREIGFGIAFLGLAALVAGLGLDDGDTAVLVAPVLIAIGGAMIVFAARTKSPEGSDRSSDGFPPYSETLAGLADRRTVESPEAAHDNKTASVELPNVPLDTSAHETLGAGPRTPNKKASGRGAPRPPSHQIVEVIDLGNAMTVYDPSLISDASEQEAPRLLEADLPTTSHLLPPPVQFIAASRSKPGDLVAIGLTAADDTEPLVSTIELRPGSRVTLGRKDGPWHREMQVSNEHVQLTCPRHGVIEVMDLGSTNGTCVNGKRLAKGKPKQVGSPALIHIANRFIVIYQFNAPHRGRDELRRTLGRKARAVPRNPSPGDGAPSG